MEFWRNLEIKIWNEFMRGKVSVTIVNRFVSFKLGPNVSIGAHVSIGPGVRIRDAIILEKSVILDHTLVLYSIGKNVRNNSIFNFYSKEGRIYKEIVTAQPSI